MDSMTARMARRNTRHTWWIVIGRLLSVAPRQVASAVHQPADRVPGLTRP